jgi:hypothetical protein
MKQTVATFRWKPLHIAARILKHTGKTVLRFMIDLEKLEFLKGIRQKSFKLSLCPDGEKQRRTQREEKTQRGCGLLKN